MKKNKFLKVFSSAMALSIILGCILNPGHGKNSSPGFQFLYTKRQISNIIKVYKNN